MAAGADIVARMILQTGNVTSGVASMSSKLKAEAEGIAAANNKIGTSANKAAQAVNKSGMAANKMSYNYGTMFKGNEAAMRSNPADSDTVQVYMTGLGAPDSTANNAAAGAGQWPADCTSIASYLAALNLHTGGAATSLYARQPNHLSGYCLSTPSMTWVHQS